jgi:lipoprotein-releasing system permease protein
MWFLAIRHLTSRKKQTFFIILGIVLGTAAYVVISGMMLGFQTFIVDQLVNNDAHIRISSREEVITQEKMTTNLFQDEKVIWIKSPSGRKDDPYIANPGGWYEKLSKDNEVFAFSEQLQLQVITSHGSLSAAAKLVGAWPEKQLQVTNIEKYMLTGRFSSLAPNSSRVVIGKGLADRLGLALGDTLLIAPGKFNPVSFKVSGIFLLGVKAIDETMMFAALSDVQKISQNPSRITDIAIRLHDVEMAKAKADDWSFVSNDKIQSWDQANDGIMSVFKTQDIVRNFMTISIILVASFGIYNILAMSVTNKKKEIAILRSMGFLPSDIKQIFLSQGLILGLLGGLMGIIIGYFVCRYIATIEVSANRGIGGKTMMMVYLPSIYIRGMLMALGSALVASWIPARSASKLGPIEIIRGEGS